MFKKIVFIVMVWMMVPHASVFGQTSSSLTQLDALSDKALEMTKMKRYEDSENMLTYFSELFLQMTAEEPIFDMDELRIITVAHNGALAAIQDDSMTSTEKMHAVTKFRLVMDAVKSTHQPMWTNLANPMLETFSQTEEAVRRQNIEQFQKELSVLLAQYEMIYPSLQVDLSTETIQQLDTRMQVINQSQMEMMTDAAAQQELVALQSDLKSIFEGMEEDEADPSLWWVIISTGGIIFTTLSYVGWKKYLGSQQERKARKKQDD